MADSVPNMYLSPRQRRRFEADYVWITSLFAVLMVLTNVIGTKLFLLFPAWLPQGFGDITDNLAVVLTAGLITYPLTFLFTDVCSEVYGRKRANRMVLIGFVSSLLMLVIVHIAVGLPRSDRFWSDVAAQPVHGTVAIEDTTGQELLVDSTAMFATGNGPWPMLVVPSQSAEAERELWYDGIESVPHRADQRGVLQLTGSADIASGSLILPAWQIQQSNELAGQKRLCRNLTRSECAPWTAAIARQ